ncbi:MAG: hypothetical protein ISR82_04375 [Candidatus Marinimicrobia bacterium]|nr:hypothetical protein [Candidatus Neomarinimicrobiota bacterium]MBL7010437.1 hypothetical protein [Candidatus Neomarinimicrobiota bacterium]MBL7030067.1 hypothetical protein [Candidatus Neomarinimicrobiota bacterium]
MDYNRIEKECFWDMDISASEFKRIIHGKDTRMKKVILEKILLNSSRVILDFNHFNIEDIKEFLNSFEIPTFNREYVFRRKNLADVYFCNKELLIDELKWAI